jgi:hypothetical protein
LTVFTPVRVRFDAFSPTSLVFTCALIVLSSM